MRCVRRRHQLTRHRKIEDYSDSPGGATFIRNRRSVPLGPGRRTRVPEPPRSIDIHKFGVVKFWQPMTTSGTESIPNACTSASAGSGHAQVSGGVRARARQCDLGDRRS
jgi:hypothetical protein